MLSRGRMNRLESKLMSYLSHRDDPNMTDHNKLLKAGDRLKDVITDAQASFSRAVYTLNCQLSSDLTDKQVSKAQQAIIEANLEIARYEDLLRRCYKALGLLHPLTNG